MMTNKLNHELSLKINGSGYVNVAIAFGRNTLKPIVYYSRQHFTGMFNDASLILCG